MTDNVIVLGAGASVDAGIPLLTNFVEKMWEFAITGKYNGHDLSEDDKKIFAEAIKVRDELDGYHGRAAFDDRNIEDILSILSFNLMGGGKANRKKLVWFIKAITRTIELTCKVTHSGQLNRVQGDNEPSVYRSFWRGLFDRFKNSASSFPSIISFNYNIVLERSLFQSIIGTYYNQHSTPFPFSGIKLKYFYNLAEDTAYIPKYVPFHVRKYDRTGTEYGVILEKTDYHDQPNLLGLELLKLHGSLNFPDNKTLEFDPVKLSEKPYILPPIINKWVGKNEETMWGSGLRRLQEAKNIIIVGYNLPQTDIYMQYFLRAGVGPNINLNKIIVCNPTLYQSGAENELMRERFGNCFSPQLRNRIVFNPVDFSDQSLNGTFEGFVDRIDNADWFFGIEGENTHIGV